MPPVWQEVVVQPVDKVPPVRREAQVQLVQQVQQDQLVTLDQWALLAVRDNKVQLVLRVPLAQLVVRGLRDNLDQVVERVCQGFRGLLEPRVQLALGAVQVSQV